MPHESPEHEPVDTGGLSFTAPATLSDYLNPESPTLYGRVSWRALFRDLGLTVVFTAFAILIGTVNAVGAAFRGVLAEARAFILGIYPAIYTAWTETVASAADVSGGEFEAFGIFALPVSVGLVLATFLVVAVVLYVFWGWRG